ncbi:MULTISPECIES: CBS domain-containing protein [unclassified Streptomyces]|uniref:CBS domain-containing protein n=1 Tax=unclassified Streptomyces TaxID=2593676 RepID=UPI001150A7CD|nr:CBS domain-containing protein [Streptomyces sp. SLBN-31]TQJ91630.1 BON domain-containing protein [Streptomyces sp. SLBN-31]
MRHRTIEDVMTREVVRTTRDTSFKTVVGLLAEHRISGLPVVDDGERVLGVISETDLLQRQAAQDDVRRGRRPRLFRLTRSARAAAAKARATTAEHLMTRPAVTAELGESVTEAARTMRRHAVERLPVVDRQGRLAGIVTRGDLLRVFLRPDEDIRRDVRDQVASALCQPRYLVDVGVTGGVVRLRGHVERRSDAGLAVLVARRVDGVVAVTEALGHRVDDSRPLPAGVSPGHM